MPIKSFSFLKNKNLLTGSVQAHLYATVYYMRCVQSVWEQKLLFVVTFHSIYEQTFCYPIC